MAFISGLRVVLIDWEGAEPEHIRDNCDKFVQERVAISTDRSERFSAFENIVSVFDEDCYFNFYDGGTNLAYNEDGITLTKCCNLDKFIMTLANETDVVFEELRDALHELEPPNGRWVVILYKFNDTSIDPALDVFAPLDLRPQ